MLGRSQAVPPSKSNETWGPDAEPEPRKSELHFTHVLVRKPPSVDSLLSIDSLTDMKACHREVASAYTSKYGVHPRAPFKSKKVVGNKKKTHRRNQSSLSSLSVGKEFSRRAKDTSKLSRIVGSMKDFNHVAKNFNHLAIIEHSGKSRNDKAVGNKKKTHRRNQSSLSSLSVGKEFSRCAKDTSKLSRIVGSMRDFNHVVKDFNHLAIISKHTGFQGRPDKPRNDALE